MQKSVIGNEIKFDTYLISYVHILKSLRHWFFIKNKNHPVTTTNRSLLGNYINESAKQTSTNQLSSRPRMCLTELLQICYPHIPINAMTTMTTLLHVAVPNLNKLASELSVSCPPEIAFIWRKIIASPQQNNKLCFTQQLPKRSRSGGAAASFGSFHLETTGNVIVHRQTTPSPPPQFALRGHWADSHRAEWFQWGS